MISIFIVLATLKILDKIQWDWVIICIPLYYLAGLLLSITSILLIIFIFYYKAYKNAKKKREENPSELKKSINVLEKIKEDLKK